MASRNNVPGDPSDAEALLAVIATKAAGCSSSLSGYAARVISRMLRRNLGARRSLTLLSNYR